MKSNKFKALIYILSALFVLSSIVCLVGCEKKEPEDESTENKTMTYEEFVDFIVPAYIEEDYGTIYANSCVKYDLILTDRLEKSGEDKAAYFKDLSDQYGTEISNYTQLKSAEFQETKQMLENQFGKDYQVTYTITKDTHFTEDETKNVGTLLVMTFQSKGYEFSRYFNPTKITDSHEITFNYTIKGSNSETVGEDTILLLEYDGKWVFGEIDL